MSAVQIVRYVSECDVENVGSPMPREQALPELRRLFSQASTSKADALEADYDLVDVETGRLVSWVLR